MNNSTSLAPAGAVRGGRYQLLRALVRRAGLGLLLGGLSLTAALAQTMEDLAVQVSAVVRSSSPQIKLSWTNANGQAAPYTIWRKAKGATSWGTQLATVASGAPTEYADNTVAVGTAYEYRIGRTSTGGEGYLFAGIELPAVESRGTVVLLVADTHAAFLATELAQLQNDLVGDGWTVLRHDVASTLTPPQVKALIKADYLADPTHVKSVFILGHVAVPYSGLEYPDGHPDHWGAWPTDVYYADMNGTWTDATANDVYGSRVENHNTPGDGHFDQTMPPRTAPGGYLLELQVGRVDMSSLPAFALSERELLQRYLRKDHQFRHKEVSVAERGLVADNFGYFGAEAFANNGWRNFSSLLGGSNVSALPYFATLGSQDFLMAYACGAGTYTSVGGTGTTGNFAAQPVKAVFNLFFGSYFGDWDNTNNLLRAAIAGDGYTLTSCWAGRPNWEFHHMGLGETVGYAAFVTQTMPSLYMENYGSGFVHAGLLGDPTLRLHPLAPPSGLLATRVTGTNLATLSWNASAAPVLGYYVYRAASASDPYVRLTPQPIAATAFADPTPVVGNPSYMVRAVQLRSSPSGSYYNLSQGMFSPVVVLPPGARWLGQSAAWASPGNWNTGQVPGSTDVAVIVAGKPYAPVVSGSATVRTLTLLPGATLTVPAGASLLVRDTLQLGASLSTTTRVLLADSAAGQPGGRLQVLEHATPAAGLLLGTGTEVAVGNGAQLTLLGNLGQGGGTAACAPEGRLVFAHDPALATGQTHTLSSLAATTAGVLRLDDARDVLVLNSALAVQHRVENLGSIVTNDNLTLLSGLGRQGVLAPVVPAAGQPLTLGSYTGNVRVQVYVDGTLNSLVGYRHLTPPVGGTTTVGNLAVGTFTPLLNTAFNSLGGSAIPFPTVFQYDQSQVSAGPGRGQVPGFNQGWLSPAALTDALPAGRGCIANMTALGTLAWSGPPRTAASFSWGTLAAGSAPGAGYHLLGNPYAAPLDWDHLTARAQAAGRPGLPLYVFKSSSQYGGNYGVYLPGVGGFPGLGVNGGSNVLPVGQAFFVRAAAPLGTPLDVQLDDLLASPSTANVQRSTADPRPRLVLALHEAAGPRACQTAIYFQAGASSGPDAGYDALSLANSGQALSLVSATGSSQYAINGQPALSGTDVRVPLQLSAATAGLYQLAAETLASLPAGYRAYLHDTQAGSYTDLATTPSFALTLAANIRISQYEVLFSTQARLLATTQSLNHSVTLSPNPAHGTATLLLPAALRGGQPIPVELRNALGQRVWAGTATAETLALPLAGLAAGVYVVQVRTSVGVVSKRLVVE